jgi:4-amino-4-deoxychorismate lyase
MFLLFETIRISNGEARHLSWHEMRMNRARLELWSIRKPVNLQELVKIPAEYNPGLVRCNVHYGQEMGPVTFKFYEKKTIRTLRMVENDIIDYHVKFFDRSLLESLFALRGDCDEIIIIKNGRITDTSMSNLIFFDGHHWFTPMEPLLKGTCRERLLSEGRITETTICPEDLHRYTGVKLINAMRDPVEEDMILISNIIGA